MNTEKTALTAIITGAVAVFAPLGPILKISLGIVALALGTASITATLKDKP